MIQEVLSLTMETLFPKRQYPAKRKRGVVLQVDTYMDAWYENQLNDHTFCVWVLCNECDITFECSLLILEYTGRLHFDKIMVAFVEFLAKLRRKSLSSVGKVIYRSAAKYDVLCMSQCTWEKAVLYILKNDEPNRGFQQGDMFLTFDLEKRNGCLPGTFLGYDQDVGINLDLLGLRVGNLLSLRHSEFKSLFTIEPPPSKTRSARSIEHFVKLEKATFLEYKIWKLEVKNIFAASTTSMVQEIRKLELSTQPFQGYCIYVGQNWRLKRPEMTAKEKRQKKTEERKRQVGEEKRAKKESEKAEKKESEKRARKERQKAEEMEKEMRAKKIPTKKGKEGKKEKERVEKKRGQGKRERENEQVKVGEKNKKAKKKNE